MPLLQLTDDQLTALLNAAKPLAPADRSSFLEAVATALRDQATIGDGVVHRAIVETQKRFRDPPLNGPRPFGTTKGI